MPGFLTAEFPGDCEPERRPEVSADLGWHPLAAGQEVANCYVYSPPRRPFHSATLQPSKWKFAIPYGPKAELSRRAVICSREE